MRVRSRLSFNEGAFINLRAVRYLEGRARLAYLRKEKHTKPCRNVQNVNLQSSNIMDIFIASLNHISTVLNSNNALIST